jgi:hypothetical protein
MNTIERGQFVRYVGSPLPKGLSCRKRYRVRIVRRHQGIAFVEDRNQNRYEIALNQLQPCPGPQTTA